MDSARVNSLTFSPDGETLSAINADPNKQRSSLLFLACLRPATSGCRDGDLFLVPSACSSCWPQAAWKA
jgi:hypothetical protein